MAGKLFNKVLNGNLKIDEFLEATDTIQKMYIGHLASLRKEHMIGDNKAASNQQHRFHLSNMAYLSNPINQLVLKII
jgi:hypothetical protein